MKEKFGAPSLSSSSPFFSQARHSNFSPSIRYQSLFRGKPYKSIIKTFTLPNLQGFLFPARIYNQWKGLDEFSLAILKHHSACSVNNEATVGERLDRADEGIKHYPLKKYYKNLLSYPMDAIYLTDSAIHPLKDVAVRRL